MDKFVIQGGKVLNGEVRISGAKNSALALMPATLLNNGKNVIKNAPEVNDIFTMGKLLSQLGAVIDFKEHNLVIDTSNIISQTAPYEHVKKMRASVYVLGPLLARYGYAKVSLPGGCAWGPRPINLHIEAMKKLGAEIIIDEGYIIAKSEKLHGSKIHFDVSSVGATGNALMASVLAKGTTLITNAAIEPEIVVLAEYLKSMGAKINGINSTTLEIEGVDELNSTTVENIPDRIEAGTILIASAITKGKVKITNSIPAHLNAVLIKLEESGLKLKYENDFVELDSSSCELNAVDVTTSVFPGFPTDMQAQWIALMTTR